MVANRHQIGVERLGQRRRCGAGEHPQHIPGMVGAAVGANGLLAAAKPQQGRRQHRRRHDQA